MRRGQNLFEIPLRNSLQSASLLDGRRTAGDAACLDTTSTQFVGAMREILSVDRVDKVTALEDLLGEIMAGMSLDQAGESSNGCDRREVHVE
jgi:hypothetical protein